MKKALSVLLVLTCLLTACQLGSGTETARFTGKVLEKYDNGCLLEVVRDGNQGFSSGDMVMVNTQINSCPEYAVGDYLTITFDGVVAESYPPQIFKVYTVEKTDGP